MLCARQFKRWVMACEKAFVFRPWEQDAKTREDARLHVKAKSKKAELEEETQTLEHAPGYGSLYPLTDYI